MTTKAIKEREGKREKLVKQYSAKRAALLEERARCYAQLAMPKADHDSALDRIAQIQDLLDAMPRNAAPKRLRNRCKLTGRPRGVYRKFQLCRNKIRELAMQGMFPGIRKSSW